MFSAFYISTGKINIRVSFYSRVFLVILYFCVLTNRKWYVRCLFSHHWHEYVRVLLPFLDKVAHFAELLSSRHIPYLEEKQLNKDIAAKMYQWSLSPIATKQKILSSLLKKNGVFISLVERKISIWDYFTWSHSTERQLMTLVKEGLCQTRHTSWSGWLRFILLKIQSHSNNFFEFPQNNNKTKRHMCIICFIE